MITSVTIVNTLNGISIGPWASSPHRGNVNGLCFSLFYFIVCSLAQTFEPILTSTWYSKMRVSGRVTFPLRLEQ